MRVLVTGAAGFVGSHLVQEFNRRAIDVIATDKNAGESETQLDILDFQKVLALINETKPDAIVHLAAISGATGKSEVEQSLRQPYLNFHVNATGTLNLCEACRIVGVSKFLYLSTFAVYGRITRDQLPIRESTPTRAEHAYGVSKLLGEEIIRTYSRDFGMKSIIFRAPFIAGEHQREKNVLREFVESAMGGRPLQIFGEGVHVREFIHPSDVADAFVRGLQHMSDSEISTELFILGNKPIRITDLASAIVARVGRGKIEHVHTDLDRTFEQFTDHQKARNMLGWAPKVSTNGIIDKIIASERQSRSMDS